MKAYAPMLLAACVLAGGCGDDESPTAPSNIPLVFVAQLRPTNEVPPVTNAESGGEGAVQITFNVTRDAAGTITAATAAFHVQLRGFPSGTTMVGAHIHPGSAGVNGPVAVNTGVTAGAPVTVGEGFTTFEATNITVAPATMQGIITNPGGYYFNVHSRVNPGGFARGQLQRIQ